MDNLWNGYKIEEFEFCGREAKLVFPEAADEKKNWALKTEYWDVFPNTETELLKNGFHIAYLQNRGKFSSLEDYKIKAEFCDYLIENYDLNEKCTLIGMSCGGANAVSLAGLYPQKVHCMFIDAPVLNYYDFPGKIMMEKGEEDIWVKEFYKSYPNYKRYMLMDFKEHPINYIQTVIENKIPIIMLYGTEDSVVDYNENGKLLEEAYKEYPELITIIPRENQEHHPHGLENPKIIVEFILKHTR